MRYRQGSQQHKYGTQRRITCRNCGQIRLQIKSRPCPCPGNNRQNKPGNKDSLARKHRLHRCPDNQKMTPGMHQTEIDSKSRQGRQKCRNPAEYRNFKNRPSQLSIGYSSQKIHHKAGAPDGKQPAGYLHNRSRIPACQNRIEPRNLLRVQAGQDNADHPAMSENPDHL